MDLLSHGKVCMMVIQARLLVMMVLRCGLGMSFITNESLWDLMFVVRVYLAGDVAVYLLA